MRKWVWIACGVVFVLIVGVVVLVLQSVQERERHIRVGKDTTFVSGPVDRDGYVDYVAAVNEEFSGGVTRENNAAVLLVRATGMESFTSEQKTVFLSALGLKKEDVGAGALVKFSDVVKQEEGETESTWQDRTFGLESAREKRPWRAVEDPKVGEWISKNERTLELLTQASLRTRFFEPLVDGSGMGCLIDMQLPGLGVSRELGNVMAARAMMRLGEGNIHGWGEDVLTLSRYGRLLMQGPTLIHRLVGMGVLTEASMCIWGGEGKVSGEEAKKLLVGLRQLEPVPELAEVIDKSERLEILGEFSALAKYGNAYGSGHGGGGIPPVGGILGDGIFPLNFEKYMQNTNRLWDMNVNAFRMTTCTDLKSAFVAVDKEETRMHEIPSFTISGATRAAWMLMTAIPTPSVSTALIEHESQIRFQLAEMGLVLAMDREKRGSYAEKLTDIAAEERAGLDQDFFSGGMLIYRREGRGYVLYSVGRNGVDDGGVWARMKIEMPVMPESVKNVVVDKSRDDIAMWVLE